MTTAHDLLQRLERHYIKPSQPLPGGIFVPEVGLNGPALQSRCDAVYVGFTSTSGRMLVGHEIKVSRADWRHELDQPGKSDRWADQCHEWYVVAPSVEIVRPEELPAGWGLMVPNSRTTTRMDVKVRATTHAQRIPSWTITRSIMARQDTLRMAAIQRVRDTARQEAQAKADAEVQKRVDARSGHSDAREKLAKVEAALGCPVDGYAFQETLNYDELRQVMDYVRAGRGLRRTHEAMAARYGGPLRTLEGIVKEAKNALAAMERVLADPIPTVPEHVRESTQPPPASDGKATP